jgi:hypothetical protein
LLELMGVQIGPARFTGFTEPGLSIWPAVTRRVPSPYAPTPAGERRGKISAHPRRSLVMLHYNSPHSLVDARLTVMKLFIRHQL